MRTHALRAGAAALVLAASTALAVPQPVWAAVPVIDAANLAQNVIEAARLLQQINNQIASLQNEATMLENETRNLTSLNVSSLSGITSDLTQIGDLMNQAQGISFQVQSVEAAFNQLYPQNYSAGTSISSLLSNAQTRWQNARDAFQQTMTVQSQIAQTVQSDSKKLSTLVDASQAATGNLAVSQATNQLLALSIKQQLQLQTLLATQGRAEAVQGANEAQAEQEGQAALTTFLGSDNAYNP
ncbi:MAG TPA: P-type conjugative transfer protein TrbJ [Acidisoma sp.]|jgi:P-type conjugative transfer protein TrbJ|uniref:P-type conjugative transfer protein TrbJ n=1 Tax=Acidisoma sp. TaxID=1872115 RepID=UPI002C42B731|nr:P-type conjugative transfer protein TrbJ [Acidisoma sp.]HTI00680.1 P-type conjugative transfer protein TrbJ [Acidisoma sp.]